MVWKKSPLIRPYDIDTLNIVYLVTRNNRCLLDCKFGIYSFSNWIAGGATTTHAMYAISHPQGVELVRTC